MICIDCPPNAQNRYYKDNFCKHHWDIHFAGTTNHQRMALKKQLREARREAEARAKEEAKNALHD